MPRVVTIMLALSLFLSIACSPPPPVVKATGVEPEANSVLVVINSTSTDSTEVGAYYRSKRDIPKENVLMVDCVTTDNIPYQDFIKQIQDPVKKAIKDSKHKIQYVVLTKGVPIRLDNDGGWSVDAFLATMN